MALSGSVATNHFSDSSVNETYMQFNWSATQSISGNYSTVNWEIVAHRVNTSNYVYFHNFTRNVNGSSGSKGSTNYKNDEVIDSGSFKVSHSDNGEGSFSISMSANVYYSSGGKISAEKTFVLDTIPRYATISHSLNSKTMNSIKVNWSSDSTCDRVEYKIDNGSWITASTSSAKSGSYTISNLSPNTTYSIYTRVRRADSQLYTTSSALSVTTYDIAKISSASDFNLGDTTTIVVTNPGSGTVSLEMKIGDTTILARTLATGTNTISFTDEELDVVYKNFGVNNTISITCILTTNNTWFNSKTVTCALTGNQKTGHTNVDRIWKRTKRWTNVDGIWKRCVRWIKVDGNWKRCI